MRVLILIANSFQSDPRSYIEAQSLVQAGYDVTVIGWDREKRNPETQIWDGIEVLRLRTWLPAECGLGKPPWHACHLLLWQWLAYRKARKLHQERGFGVVHCHFFDTLPVGIRLKQTCGLPVVYDPRDLWGYMMQASLPRWFANIFLGLEKWLLNRADRIIAVNEPVEEYFAGVTDRPVSVIMNCKPLQSRDYRPRGNEGNFTLLYIGVLHKMRAVSRLISVVKELTDVRCIIGGVGESGYVNNIKEECSRYQNIDFVGRVAVDDVLPMTGEADVIFSMFDPGNPDYRIATPNKLFEAMVCGRPILCTKGTYAAEMAEREGFGLAVDYTDEALKQAIIKLRDDRELRERLGRNALKVAIARYNWQMEEQKLLGLYRTIEAPKN